VNFYNASAVKIYNATSCLVRFENKNIFFYFKNVLVYYNACKKCKKLIHRPIFEALGSMYILSSVPVLFCRYKSLHKEKILENPFSCFSTLKICFRHFLLCFSAQEGSKQANLCKKTPVLFCIIFTVEKTRVNSFL
jgi:hypothetical protein